jgi:hypothetical protein
VADGQVRSRIQFGRWLRRRWQFATVPPDERCSFCPQRAVAFESSGTPPFERTARCLDHPPDALKDAGNCKVCGRRFWPDFLHLDCAPPEEL